MSAQYSEIERQTILEKLQELDMDITYTDLVEGKCKQLTDDILLTFRSTLVDFNEGQLAGCKYKIPSELSVQGVSQILKYSKDVCMVRFAEQKEPKLACRIRDRSAPENGIWVSPDEERYESKFNAMILGLHPGADTRFIKETRNRLCIEMSIAKDKIRKAICDGIHVPCKNGVYNRTNHTFMDWDNPLFDNTYENEAFTFKIATAYNPLAKNEIITVGKDGEIHEPWDFESSVLALFDDNQEMSPIYVQAFWEIAAHAISGFSESFMWFWINKSNLAAGSSGKSTALNALKAVIGEENVCDYNLNQLTDGKYSMAGIVG
jgi:hypothetical protein